MITLQYTPNIHNMTEVNAFVKWYEDKADMMLHSIWLQAKVDLLGVQLTYLLWTAYYIPKREICSGGMTV